MDKNFKDKILLFAAIFATTWVIMLYITPPKDAEKNATESQQAESATQTKQVDAVKSSTTEAAVTEQSAAVPNDNIEIKTKGYTAVFSTLGASLKSYTLNDYYNVTEKEEAQRIPLPLIAKMNNAARSLAIQSITINETTSRLDGLHWNLITKTDNKLVFEKRINGVTILRTYSFDDENKEFGFDHAVEFKNTSSKDVTIGYNLNGPAGIVPDDVDKRFGLLNGISGYLDDKKEIEKESNALSELTDEALFTHANKDTAWLGLHNRFFASLIINNTPSSSISAVFNRIEVDENFISSFPEGAQIWLNSVMEAQPIQASVTLKLKKVTLKPNTSTTNTFEYYGGPLEDKIAAKFNILLEKVVSYSWSFLETIARFLLSILQLIASYVGNYGWSIILLTIIVKLCLHPLTRKSMASQHKMQKVQPLLKELKKKYPNDPKKQQQETMKLFQENGVNPVGGCLPMLLQMPIFFALYGVFAKSFAIRQMPFISGWIDDLSMPDEIMQLPFTVPYFDWTSLNLLPIVYLIFQLIHMGMMPKSEDPQAQQQQKMMKFMPLIFVFIFYTMPSGLVLYFVTQSLLTIIEHKLIKSKIAKNDSQAVAVSTTSGEVITPAGTGVGKKKAGKPNKKKKK